MLLHSQMAILDQTKARSHRALPCGWQRPMYLDHVKLLGSKLMLRCIQSDDLTTIMAPLFFLSVTYLLERHRGREKVSSIH